MGSYILCHRTWCRPAVTFNCSCIDRVFLFGSRRHDDGLSFSWLVVRVAAARWPGVNRNILPL